VARAPGPGRYDSLVPDLTPSPAGDDHQHSLVRSLYGKVDHLVHEVMKFGVVGIVALVFDVGLFNLLMFSVHSPLYNKPLSAKIASVAVATTVAYFGNRYWTFRHRGRTSFGREYFLFFVLNGVGLLISVGCLWFSHYALGFTSALADNISANVIGLALGTIFRFWSYRRWVFPEDDDAAAEATLESTV